jgi:hypothetical protein
VKGKFISRLDDKRKMCRLLTRICSHSQRALDLFTHILFELSALRFSGGGFSGGGGGTL